MSVDIEELKRAKTFEEEALKECDKAVLNNPGAVQNHGVVFATNANVTKLEAVSQNLKEHFGVDPKDVLKQGLGAFFSALELHEIRNVVGRSSARFQESMPSRKLLKTKLMTSLCRIMESMSLLICS